jgi:hypothetical protein
VAGQDLKRKRFFDENYVSPDFIFRLPGMMSSNALSIY